MAVPKKQVSGDATIYWGQKAGREVQRLRKESRRDLAKRKDKS